MYSVGLRAVFHYDSQTGAITRLVRMGNHQAGTVCNAKYQTGYRKVTYKGQQMLAHRLAWYLHYAEQPPKQIDHINQNRADNRLLNLRAADASTNQMNIGVHTRSQTGTKGIMPVRGGALYRAEVCVQGKRYQKHAKDPQALADWVKQKREQVHEDFAKH